MKHKIKKSEFLNWYFSDREDSQIMGNRIKDNLLKSEDNTVTITVRELLNECALIPSHIIEDCDEEDVEFPSENCIIIDD